MLFAATATLPEVNVRKCVLNVDNVWHDGGTRAAQPLQRGSIAAVLHNPYAGRYVADIQPMMEALKRLAGRSNLQVRRAALRWQEHPGAFTSPRPTTKEPI